MMLLLENQMGNIKLSIFCLTFNHGKFLEQCLEGFFLQQTSFKFEILLNDDASTDNTQEIISRYRNMYPDVIKPIFQKKNKFSQGERGMNYRYNFPRAQGDFIAICEGDDSWTDPYKLQKQVDFLEKNAEYVMTYHDAHAINAEGELLKENIVPADRKRDFSNLELQQGILVMPLTMCFRNIFKGVDEYPKEVFDVRNGDTFLISLLGNYGKGKFMDNIDASLYREHSGGIWSNLSYRKRSVQHVTTYEKMLQYYKRIGNTELSEYFNYKLVNAHLSLMQHSINNKDYKKAWYHGKFVWSRSPERTFQKVFLLFKAIIKEIIYGKH